MIRLTRFFPRGVRRAKLWLLLVAICAACLLCASTVFATLAFGVHHVLSTPSTQRFPVFFYLQNGTEALTADVSLSQQRLRYAASLTAHLHLSLPESDHNLRHSVFSIYTELQSNEQSKAPSEKGAPCLAAAKAQAVMRFRSSTYRSIRALVMALPLLVGIADEYQRIQVPILYHKLPRRSSPCPDTISIQLQAPVQVSSAKLVLYVSRRPFVSKLLREQATSFMLVTTLLWYGMLIVLGLSVLIIIELRLLFRYLLRQILSRKGVLHKAAPKTTVCEARAVSDCNEPVGSTAYTTTATKGSATGLDVPSKVEPHIVAMETSRAVASTMSATLSTSTGLRQRKHSARDTQNSSTVSTTTKVSAS